MPTNRLANEKSPYLLQHAHNPVDWYPWGDEAFAKAAAEDKPVFLSVGYSTCHWCHVMERESFESDQIAALLNQYYVPIKVDREERPDVDRVYMLFVQASTGSGGWPMSVWLTPDRKPFFGGTYFPPDNRYGRPGFAAILSRLAEAWREDRARVEHSGSEVLKQLEEYATLTRGDAMAGMEVWDPAFQAFRRMFDPQLGGFGRAPKFPRPSIHNFLLRFYHETKNDDALDMVLKTLQEMAKGGMNDQLGGGFHRYSVDERWFVPHFEKMLYDQAQLATSYLEAFQITRDEQYAKYARDIFTYILRDMTGPDGGFYSAEDADSARDAAHLHEKAEGAFYVWAKQEITNALGEPASAIFCDRFAVREGGNVDEDPHGEFQNQNILFEARSLEDIAARNKLSMEQIRTSLEKSVKTLLERRAKRPRPLRDDKVLTGWNGMMISAFAIGAQILNQSEYAEIATKTVAFIRRHLWDESRSVLLRRHREGESLIDGFLDDYGFFGLALVDLYETTFDSSHLRWAIQLAELALARFEDRENGGFFSTEQDSVLLRLKDDYDGAEPSGNSAMALLLLRLARMTGRREFAAAAERTLKAFRARLEESGTAVPQMMVAHMFALSAPREIVLAGPLQNGEDLLKVIRNRFQPNTILMRSEDVAQEMPAQSGKLTVYVCENFACQLPLTGAVELEQLLGKQ